MSAQDAIGGYFGLELAKGAGHRYESAIRFQSGRAAFLSVLAAHRPRRVWMPWFICNSMLEPLEQLGIDVRRYSIDDDLAPQGQVAPERDECLLCVNYFGLCDAHIERLCAQLDSKNLIVDNAQAFYSTPGKCLATVYSPRKFFGVADGGYAVSRLALNLSPADIEGSVARAEHLLLRAANGAEYGYRSFLEAENTLARQEAREMSRLTASMLAAIDYEAVARRRRENFLILDAALRDRNLFKPVFTSKAVPLCYPYRTDRSDLREELIAARIYVPTFWPELLERGRAVPAEIRKLAQTFLPLPCDQRYGPAHMAEVVDVITRAEEKK